MSVVQGDIVLFHHIDDGEDYPAVAVKTRPVVGHSVSSLDGGIEWLLRVFRPRDETLTRWTSEGTDPGQFSESPRIAALEMRLTALEQLVGEKDDGPDGARR